MWKFWSNKGEKQAEESVAQEEMNEDFGTQEADEQGGTDSENNESTEAFEAIPEERATEAAAENTEEDNADTASENTEENSGETSKPKKGSFWKWLGFGRDSDDSDEAEEDSDEKEGAEDANGSETDRDDTDQEVTAQEEIEKDEITEESTMEPELEETAEKLISTGETSEVEAEVEANDDLDSEGLDEEGDAEETDAEEAESLPEKKGFFARLKAGLAKTRDNIVKGIDRLFSGSALDDDFYEELEEILIMGDIGVNATTAIIEKLKMQVKEQHIKEPKDCKEFLIRSIREQMEVGETAYDFETKQSIIMVIGVNGVGKTTTVGKLAWKLKDEGKKVLIAAADTFRAAAGDQLAQWASRAGVPMIGGKEGADPASVVFDAVSAAKARGVDILLIDTAGRLHNKKNLMEELRKMNRIIDKEYPNAHRENLIVLDGTTGQNAMVQAREFGDVTNLTGIVLTKMDGTAKGGIAVAIQSELKIPVKYIGVGETTQDLQKFDPDDFVRALFDVDLSEKNENDADDEE